MTSTRDRKAKLHHAIMLLKLKQEDDFELLKHEARATTEYFKPSNMISRTVDNLKQDTKVRGNLKETLVSIAIGFATKRLMIGKSNSFIKAIIGYFIQHTTSKLVKNKMTDE